MKTRKTFGRKIAKFETDESRLVRELSAARKIGDLSAINETRRALNSLYR